MKKARVLAALSAPLLALGLATSAQADTRLSVNDDGAIYGTQGAVVRGQFSCDYPEGRAVIEVVLSQELEHLIPATGTGGSVVSCPASNVNYAIGVEASTPLQSWDTGPALAVVSLRRVGGGAALVTVTKTINLQLRG
ncbi:hypothetical protein [Streptomyces sp. CBMA152]|uniref:hypothetical protein n=1 Tax=Streptomyces sp. CBMA152 TaxID=1896312 RepID=UPI0016608B05|nr:hypothetical protein [Streptomyces sp. CBMA152]MBD0742933.1 hypothetical protein [Streptomyces sp. CBMA152]